MYEPGYWPDYWIRHYGIDGIVVGLTGHGIILAFPLGAAVALCNAFPYSISAKGAAYAYAKRLLGDKAGFFYLGMFVLSQVLIATFAKGFVSYFVSLFPMYSETVVAMIALTIAVILNINIIGLKSSAAVQNLMIILLLASPALFAGFGLPQVDWSCLAMTKANMIPNGFEKIFTAVAQKIFPFWLYVVFVVGGAMFALATTLNGTLSWVTRGLQVAASEGWLPEACAKKNKAGTPIILLMVFYVVGALLILSGMDLSTISSMGVGTDILTEFVILVACWQLPKKFSNEFKASMFYMEEKKFHMVLTVIGGIMLYTSYVNLSDLTVNEMIGLAVYFVILFAYTQYRYKYVSAKRKAENR